MSVTTRWLSRLYYHKDALHPEQRLEQARLRALSAAKATIEKNKLEKSQKSQESTTINNQHKKGTKRNHQIYMTKPPQVKLPPNDGTSSGAIAAKRLEEKRYQVLQNIINDFQKKTQ